MSWKRVSSAVVITLFVAAAYADDIDIKAKAVGAARLGKASGAVKTLPGGAKVRMYSKGAIYWSPEGGTHAIYGPAYAKYKASGGASGALGYPVTDVTPAANGGSEIILQHGAITVSKSGAAAVRRLPWVTFTTAGATLSSAGKASMASATDALLLPQGGSGGGETTITCKCAQTGLRLPLGSCDVNISGNTITCNKGSCESSCQVTLVR